ncbi:MAG TPA: hypothetical protein VGG70_06185 [Candidatus Cybelea sp.]|jgi:hypothetical protein
MGIRTLGVGAALTLLAGCSGSLERGVPSSLPAPAPRSSLHQISRIDPAARGKDLLYASSIYDCNVYVFTYPRGKPAQTLDACGLGFGPAFGLCSDKDGDVFMGMAEGFSIFEYVHGGSQPIAQLQDDSLLPFGCSVDPKSGDLGVTSVESNVVIYKNASGTPQLYYLSGVEAFYFCTYDDRGNLFADGKHYDGSFALAELPKGGNALREISVPGSVGAGFALQWDGRHVALGTTRGSNEFVLDRIRVSGSAAKIVGTTTLTFAPNMPYSTFQFWLHGGKIVQPENDNAEIGFWKYPRGGEEIREIPIQGSSLVGVTVSAAPR